MDDKNEVQNTGKQRRGEVPAEREATLRKQLGVSETATVNDIVKLIVDTGCVPRPMSTTLSGERLYACPVSRGIFTTVQADEYGRVGQAGSPTPMLAVLEALQRAREMFGV
jgi:hypothetical protein